MLLLIKKKNNVYFSMEKEIYNINTLLFIINDAQILDINEDILKMLILKCMNSFFIVFRDIA